MRRNPLFRFIDRTALLLVCLFLTACGTDAVLDESADPGQDGAATSEVASDVEDPIDTDNPVPVDDDARELEPNQFHFGDEAPLDPPWVDERRDAQLADSEGWTVDHDLTFTDRLPESGITFRHQPVPDSTKNFTPNHYDHGNGIPVADVDGDGVLDIYFINQVGSNELWRGLGDGTFEDITAQAGVALADVISVTASFADVDNDGDPDLFTTSVLGGNHLFLNDGSGSFTDATEESGLTYSGHSSSGTFFDYDNDGLLDLFLANVGVYTTGRVMPAPIDSHDPSLDDDMTYTYVEGRGDAFAAHVDPLNSEPSILYHNLGEGRFEDVSQATGLVETGWNGDANPIDVNNDGWLDLYVTDMQGDDDYWENIGGQRFEKKPDGPFPVTPWGAMGIQVLDWNNDGLQDIFVTDMHSDMVEDLTVADEKLKARALYPRAILQTDRESIFGNGLFEQQVDGSFNEISDDVNAENFWPWGLSTGDLNADGYEDAFIASSMNYFFRYGVNSVLLNEGGSTWRDAEFVVGAEPRRDGVYYDRWYTLDCDGVNADHIDCINYGPGLITRWHPLGTRSSVIVDIDYDGDLDIVTGEYASVPQVLINDLNERRTPAFITVDLVGSASNRDGLGATVVVETGNMRLTKVHDGKSGYTTQSSIPLYFGLGDAESVDAVRVTWPSGAEQVVDGPIASGERLEIIEP